MKNRGAEITQEKKQYILLYVLYITNTSIINLQYYGRT